MTMMSIRPAVIAAIFAFGSTHTLAQHAGDFLLRECHGRIGTGVVDAGGGSFPEFVLPSEFGELVPDFSDEPGFDSEAGAFTPGIGIGFSIRKAVRVWDGASFDTIAGPRIEIRKGPNAVTSPEGDVPVAGFVFGLVAANGIFHQHLGFTILPPASDGVYLLELELWSNDAGLAASEPIWIVFAQNADEVDHESAVEFVESSIVDRCRADLTGNGQLNVFDFLAFQTAFTNDSAEADFNRDCVLNIFDFLEYQTAFGQGC